MLRKLSAILLFCLISDAFGFNYPKQFIIFDYNFNNSSSALNYQSLFNNQQYENIFANGNGNGYNFKLSYNRLIINDLYLGGAINFNSDNSIYDLFRNETIGVNGELFNGTFSKNLEMLSWNANISIYAEKFVARNLSLQIGAEYSFINDYKYDYSEKIIYPENEGVFLENLLRSRNFKNGNIDNLAIWNIFTSARYYLPLSKQKNLFIVPQISYNYSFYNDNFIESRIGNFSIGIGISYFFDDYLDTKSEKVIEIIPVDFDAMITISGIENGIENYVDSIEVVNLLETNQMMCKLSTVNFNIIASNFDLIQSWKLIVFTENNEFRKEMKGENSIPSYISWDIYKDEELKKSLKLFSMLSSSFPPKFDLDLNYQLIITSETGYIYSTEIKNIKLFLKSQ